MAQINLPKKYRWLNTLKPLPWVIEQGLALYGIKEVEGAGNNQTILEWADEVAEKSPNNYSKWAGRWYDKDSIPWCGLWCAVVALRAHKDIPKNYLRALAWSNFGEAIEEEEAGLGDVLVFTRRGGGHVGFYIAEDPTHYHVLGGNQSNSVNITRIAKSRLYSVNRPIYNNKPGTVRKYHMAPTGEVSFNEA